MDGKEFTNIYVKKNNYKYIITIQKKSNKSLCYIIYNARQKNNLFKKKIIK